MLKQYRYLTIKIDVERESKKTKSGTEYIDKFFFVDIIDTVGGRTEFAVPISKDFGESLKKTFRRIVEELHLG